MILNHDYKSAVKAIAMSVLATLGGVAALHATPATAIASDHAAVQAHLARTLKATDTARLRYISAAGSALREEGPATGTLPGRMKVSMNVGTTFSGTFTIYLKGGMITGHGTATPHGIGVVESFSGTLNVTKGTGRYARARGQAGLYGTFNRNSYALVIQTTGNLSY